MLSIDIDPTKKKKSKNFVEMSAILLFLRVFHTLLLKRGHSIVLSLC
ncbi:hypothetical protein CCPUN_07640 [Cardinium endosymbiont of Culicoides punctatus]|nr:hypothetical protein CCPUN_07640 [Cardinium endosymbiont of Culicoides punctatus]